MVGEDKQLYECFSDLSFGDLHLIITLYFYPIGRGNKVGKKNLEERLCKMQKLDNKLLHMYIRNVDLNQKTLLNQKSLKIFLGFLKLKVAKTENDFC